uniref:Uncharacterized protein n=1 Tax=Glossina austeni TaxID=7395 RepID=A0A1A9UPI7_GLOAU
MSHTCSNCDCNHLESSFALILLAEFNRNGILSCEAHEYECTTTSTTTTTATNSECNENAKGAAKGYRLISCFLAGSKEKRGENSCLDRWLVGWLVGWLVVWLVALIRIGLGV